MSSFLPPIEAQPSFEGICRLLGHHFSQEISSPTLIRGLLWPQHLGLPIGSVEESSWLN